MSIFKNHVEDITTRGCVVKEWEHNGYDDSDFFALVYNPETETFYDVMWGTTRCASIGYGDNCVVDATPEVLKKYAIFQADTREKAAIYNSKIEAATPRIGKYVRSLTTRGKAFQKSGKIFWIGANKFLTYYKNGYTHPEDHLVVGFITNNGEKYFVPKEKCEVINE